MTYIARNGRIWAMPYGAEVVGTGSDGVPLYYTGGEIGPMKPITPKSVGKETA